jgi:hypothetical protein
MNFKGLLAGTLIIATTLIGCQGQKRNSPSQTSDKREQTLYLTSTDSTGQLMHEDEFWKLVDESRTAAKNDYQAQVKTLKIILLTRNADDIEKFDNTFTAILAASYDWKLWGASHVINGGCSDDCFHYFRQYLIGHGKERFYQTLKDPESCVNWIKAEEEDHWEGLQYAAAEAYNEKTGKDLPQTYKAKFELKGEPFDEETVFKHYPKLSKKFMGEEK